MDDQIISRFANIGQILGLKNVKSAFAVLTLGSIWQTGTWFFGSNVRIDLGQWWLAVAALCFLVYLWLILRPENLIRNPRFAEGTRYWGSGYLEDEVRDGVHSAEIARLPYVVHPDSSKTESSGEHVQQSSHHGSFRFIHRTEKRANIGDRLPNGYTGLNRIRHTC